MNRKILALGGVLLIAGGVVYYFKDYFNGNGNGTTNCSDYTTQSTCESNGCYWYDNSCHATPQNVSPCTIGVGPCSSNLVGYRSCDAYDNLCECDGSDYQLIQENCQDCIDGIYHTECFRNQYDELICLNQVGAGQDECQAQGLPIGCDCTNYACNGPYIVCEPTIKECVQQAAGGINISANRNNCDLVDTGHGEEAYYTLPGTYYCAKLVGDLSFYNAFAYLYHINLEVYAGLRGTYTLIGEQRWDYNPGSGTHTFNLAFPAQGIDQLKFVLYQPFGEPRFDSFNGTVSYP